MTALTTILAAGEASGGGGGFGFISFLPIVLIFGIFYLLVFRPQKKERQKRQEMVNNVRKNDKIVTIGGIHGVVRKVEDAEVVIAIDAEEKDKMRIRIAKSAIHDVKNAGDSALDPPSDSIPEPLE